eukprot:1932896-Prymnesium_polylepis.3
MELARQGHEPVVLERVVLLLPNHAVVALLVTHEEDNTGGHSDSMNVEGKDSCQHGVHIGILGCAHIENWRHIYYLRLLGCTGTWTLKDIAASVHPPHIHEPRVQAKARCPGVVG